METDSPLPNLLNNINNSTNINNNTSSTTNNNNNNNNINNNINNNSLFDETVRYEKKLLFEDNKILNEKLLKSNEQIKIEQERIVEIQIELNHLVESNSRKIEEIRNEHVKLFFNLILYYYSN